MNQRPDKTLAPDFNRINEKVDAKERPGVERSRSGIDLKSARREIKRWQKPFRKV